MEKETTYKIIITILSFSLLGVILSLVLLPDYNQKLKDEGKLELLKEIFTTQSVPARFINCRLITEEGLGKTGYTNETIKEILNLCKENKLILTDWIKFKDE